MHKLSGDSIQMKTFTGATYKGTHKKQSGRFLARFFDFHVTVLVSAVKFRTNLSTLTFCNVKSTSKTGTIRQWNFLMSREK